MPTYFLFGAYTPDAIRGISAARTEQVREEIARCGGRVREIYALLGERDVCLIVDLPGSAEAMRLSIRLTRLTGICFTTSHAIPIDEFDRVAQGELADVDP
ncbi:MAG: GYD domain-containing protein [Planctomycetota bacterium]|nr:MAG: GYD domain-containing protein [Planctomycetota bacterium]